MPESLPVSQPHSEVSGPDLIEKLYIENPSMSLVEFRRAIQELLVKARVDELDKANDTLYHTLPTGESLDAFEILKAVQTTQSKWSERRAELQSTLSKKEGQDER